MIQVDPQKKHRLEGAVEFLAQTIEPHMNWRVVIGHDNMVLDIYCEFRGEGKRHHIPFHVLRKTDGPPGSAARKAIEAIADEHREESIKAQSKLVEKLVEERLEQKQKPNTEEDNDVKE